MTVPSTDRADALEQRLRSELGDDAHGVPPPPPAPPPSGLGRLRARASVRIWRVRAAIPESLKKPMRKLLRRPYTAELAEPEQPSDVVRALEDLQISQVELTRRLAQLEERMTGLESARTEEQ
jgi:hypothetical protein